MKERKYQPQKLVKLKNFIAIVAAVLLIMMVVMIIKLLSFQEKEYKNITTADFAQLQSGELVKGIIDRNDVVVSYPDVTADNKEVICLGVLSADRKLIVFSAVNDNGGVTFSEMKRMISGEVSSVSFKGTVGFHTDSFRSTLGTIMFTENTYRNAGISEQDVMDLMIKTTDLDSDYYVQKMIGLLIGVALMLLLIWYLLRKSVNNIIYGLMVQKGLIQPELKVRKEDLVIDNTVDYYEGSDQNDSFYVNTDYNVHHSLNDPVHNDKPVTSETAPDSPASYEENIVHSTDSTDFYQGGINEEGNFFVNTDTESDSRFGSNERKRY